MKNLSLRTQLWIIGVGYAAFLAYAADLIYERYMQYVNHPQDAAASPGMYAFGDSVLAVYLVCLFMVPTVFLIWVMSRFESVYAFYSKALLVLSLTAPISLLLIGVNELPETSIWRDISLSRLMWSPFIIVGLGTSRLMAKFSLSKRLSSYALVIEGVTFCIVIAVIIASMALHER